MKKLALILGLILGLNASAKAQTTVALMPIPKPQFFGQNGLPLAGCKIFTYQSGTSTPQGTFFDSGGTISNPNPVTCDAGGFVSIWLIVGDTYRILVQDQNGVQQYLMDGVVGVGGGTLSLFSTPNTWTALQTFPGGINASGGGTLSGVFTGSPSLSGTWQFSTFTISNSTVIANLNASLWNGTSVTPAGGALTSNFVPVITGGSTATWELLPLGSLPGSGVTTINGTSCTISLSCGPLPNVTYSTPSASTNASIGATTMVTVGASNATYTINFYASQTVLGASCTGNTTLVVSIIWQDPVAGAPVTVSISRVLAVNNGALGTASDWQSFNNESIPIRAKTGTVIQYSVAYTIGTGCSPGPSYQLFPILQQVMAS